MPPSDSKGNMLLKFDKYHGTGNDFVIINFLKEEKSTLTKKQIIKICKRNFGIGADGILAVLPSKTADYKMRVFNPDGSEPEMCGNGVRCFVKYLHDQKLTRGDSVKVETLAGIKPSIFYTENDKFLVEVSMGSAKFKDNALFKNTYINQEIKGRCNYL